MKKNANFQTDIPRRLVYYDKDFENYLSCDVYGENCTSLTLDLNQKVELISQEFVDKDKNSLIFIGKKRFTSPQDGWFNQNIKKINQEEFKKQYIDVTNNLKFAVIGNVSYIIDQSIKTITFEKNNDFGKIIFSDGNLNSWHVKFTDNLNNNDKPVFKSDKNGLTGCLTFIDMKVDNAVIEIENANSEDSLNFIRSTGTIKFLKITNAQFDAMDADFSNILFEKIEVIESGNDCLDFSYGKYSRDDDG